MAPELYKVRWLDKSFLATMPRPQGGIRLPGELESLRRLGVGVLVSLLEPDEAHALGLSRTAEIARSLHLDFKVFPIPDFGAPTDLDGFTNLAKTLARRLRAGVSVACHCRGGIGRSTLLAAAIMVSLGDDPSTVLGAISRARGLVVPDTTRQKEWFHRVSTSFCDADGEGEGPV
jgi:hypothetical protein